MPYGLWLRVASHIYIYTYTGIVMVCSKPNLPQLAVGLRVLDMGHSSLYIPYQ